MALIASGFVVAAIFGSSPIACGFRHWSTAAGGRQCVGRSRPVSSLTSISPVSSPKPGILLMFGVGLHFSASDLLAVRGIAVQARSVVGTGHAGRHGRGLPLGLSLGVSIVFRPLHFRGEHRGAAEGAGRAQLVQSRTGRVAINWLIVEDLAMVVALVATARAGGTARRQRRRPWRQRPRSRSQ